MLNKIFLCIVICAVCSFGQVVTTKKVQKAEGLGIGSTRVEAVNEAISEAVGQITGVKIKKQSLVENIEVQNSDNGSLSIKYNSKINKITNGKADSYKILSVNNRADGLYEAKVLVTNTKTTKKYKLAGMDNKRRSIAIMPPQVSANFYKINNEEVEASQISQSLSQELVTALTKTRKFNILDRDNLDSYAREKNLLISGNSPDDELLKLGNLMGADYLLTTKITNFSSVKKAKSKYSADFSSFGSNSTVKVIIEYRIMAMATMQVKWSDTISKNIKVNSSSVNEIIHKAISEISNEVSTQLLENIYPIKIIQADGSEFILNQGSLKNGNIYEVFTLGKKLYDPYTKEYIGQKESKVGTIQIVKSTAKYSTAKLLEGTPKQGDIIRLK